MKTLKQFLCFLGTSVICTAVYVIATAVAMKAYDLASFMGLGQYIKLIIADKMFLRALINTALLLAVVPFVTAAIAVVAKHCFKLYKFSNFNIGAYAILAVVNTVYGTIAAVKSFGYPSMSYAPSTIVSTASLDIRSILIALQTAIFACFIFWLADLLITKFKHKTEL